MKVLISDLKAKTITVLSKNMTKEDSESAADYFMYAEMSGNKTQGIMKMAGETPIQNIIADYPVKLEKETPVSAIIDGGKNPAIVVANKAVEIVLKKAKEVGMAIVGSKNIFSSNGAQAYYVEQLAKQDLIGIMVSRSPSTVAPFNAIEPLFGTNPIGFAFPTNDDPIIFDAATAAITFYGLIAAKDRNEKIPEGLAIDKEGNPTINPAEVIECGSILPFGNSYKAAGLGMLVELLSGPLIGGSYLDCKTFDKEWGSTIIAIDPNILTDAKQFKANCSDFVNIIKNSRTKENEKITFPNDKARKSYNEALQSGYVEVDEVIYNQIFGDLK